MSKFCTKNALLENLKSQNFNKLLSYLKSAPSNFLMAKLQEKAKMPKSGTKMPYLDIFDQKCFIWVFLS